MATRKRKLLLTALVVGTTGTVAGLGSFAAFTATTVNTGNQIATGTVIVADNDSGTAMYPTTTNQAPGATTVRCMRVTYTGTLAATVRLYRTGTITNGTAFNVQIERGSGTTGAYPSCTGFTTAATLYNGALGATPTTFAAGPDAKGSAWASGNTVDYRFTLSVVDDPTPNAHATALASGTHGWTWEAQNN